MSIGSRIKERRESLGLTQVQLAELLGVTKGAIGNYETDANSPKASMLYKVFDILKCDANYLFQDEIREQKEKAASAWEMEHIIKKYRALDQYGKDAVTAVLDCELKRIREQKETATISPETHIFRIAGRDGSYIEQSLTDAQMANFQAYIDSLEDADEDGL